MRTVGIVIQDDEIVLIRRIKNGEEYYTFPGGTVEEGESPEETVKREIKEELGLTCTVGEPLFEIENNGNKEFYYSLESCLGDLKLGGPEAERMTEENQYILEKKTISEIKDMKNLYPQEAAEKLIHNS